MHCFRTQVSPVYYNNSNNQKLQDQVQSFFANTFQQHIFHPVPEVMCRLCQFAGWRGSASGSLASINKPALVKRLTGMLAAIRGATVKYGIKAFGKASLPALVMGALILPTKSLTGLSIGTLDKVMLLDTFRVATILGDSTLYQEEGYRHGFGYDVARGYASHLGTELVLETFETEAEALAALQAGEVDAYLSANAVGDSLSDTQVEFAPLSCDGRLSERGLSDDIRLNFRIGGQFARDAKNYLCTPSVQAHTLSVARFYDTEVLNPYSKERLTEALTKKLPRYEAEFKKAADKYNHDWHLLAAISYQESRFDPEAVSPTGVRGLMMLTTETADAMGVSDRTNVAQSINGGAKYLEVLVNQFDHVPESDRLWFVLAGYNMGPNAVKRIQNKLADDGQDPNRWSNVYSYLSANINRNSRYGQCMHYVTNIRSYLEIIKGGNYLAKVQLDRSATTKAS